MSRVLFRINIAAIQKICDLDLLHLTLTFFPWHLTLIFDLETDLLLPWCFEENITKMYCFDVTWRKNGTSYVRTETNLSISILSVNILQPTRSLYGFRFQSYGSKGDFQWFDLDLFQGHLIFVNSPFVPLHDWCTFWSDMLIDSGYIAHWNMEKLPILYNGNFRCHGNVCYVFPINPFFCKLYRIGPSNMCVILRGIGWILTILDDFINQPYHIDNIQNSENFQMTLTFDLYLTLTLSFTFDLDDWKKFIFFNFFIFFWSRMT